LAGVGDAEGARRALQIAKRRLEERAASISRPEGRRSFLEFVPEHKRTLDVALRWGV